MNSESTLHFGLVLSLLTFLLLLFEPVMHCEGRLLAGAEGHPEPEDLHEPDGGLDRGLTSTLTRVRPRAHRPLLLHPRVAVLASGRVVRSPVIKLKINRFGVAPENRKLETNE